METHHGNELDWREIVVDARESAVDAVNQHLRAGFSIYSCGTGNEANLVYEHTPDGKVYEIVREGESFRRVRERGEQGIEIAL